MNYGEVLKRPFSDFKKLLIGIVLSIVPIISFFALGYFLECARTANAKKYELPEWKNLGDLFVSGFYVFIITLVYFIPAMLLLVGVFGFTVFRLALSVDTELIPKILETSIPLLLIAVVLLVLTGYIVYSAILRFALTKKLSSAFSFGDVFRGAFNMTYFGAWIMGVLTYMVIGAILGGIGNIGNYFVVKYFASGITSFIGGVIFYTILGEDYKA